MGFLTATKRGGQWLNSVDNPYTKQYDKLQPTFAHILDEKRKKVDLIRSKRKIIDKSVLKSAPFNIQASRNFEYASKTLGPGPGSYIDINNPKYSSVLHKHTENIQSTSTKKTNLQSNFGSSIDRFNNPDYKKSVETPGPGAYTNFKEDSPKYGICTV
jgi:hypothetical protein